MNEREFIYGLATLCGDSIEQKIRLCFQTADDSGDGRISADELQSLLETWFKVHAIAMPAGGVCQMVEGIFREASASDEDGLAFEQFREAIYDNDFILRIFSTSAADDAQVVADGMSLAAQAGALAAEPAPEPAAGDWTSTELLEE